ncbi:MAG: LysR family transcriptional regulator [Leucobacter sp.]
MELRQLRYFLAVADELHFGRAADRLHISQPPLSVAIRALEQELGTPLFVRSTRAVSLTAAGETFRDRISPVIDEFDAVIDELHEVRDGTRGRLRVGFVSSASYSILPRAVQRFQQRFPLVELHLTPLASAEQLSRLLDGQLDLGILRDPSPVPGIETAHVLSERLVAVLPEGHPLTAEEVLSTEQLHDEPLVLFPYHLMPGYLARIMQLLEGSGVRPRIVQRAVHQETVIGLVAAGVGLSILPESVASVLMPGAVMRPFEPGLDTELHLAWHSDPTPAVCAFTACASGQGVGDAGPDDAEDR